MFPRALPTQFDRRFLSLRVQNAARLPNTIGRHHSDDSCCSGNSARSEEHTSELQSLTNLVCRLLLDTAPSDIYTLSLHDALPILVQLKSPEFNRLFVESAPYVSSGIAHPI